VLESWTDADIPPIPTGLVAGITGTTGIDWIVEPAGIIGKRSIIVFAP
jgi:hypothetical protein